jgi:hypothetical protein
LKGVVTRRGPGEDWGSEPPKALWNAPAALTTRTVKAVQMADPDLSRLEAHPAAGAYRLMTDDELADLAASIAENRLRDPITVGVLEGKRFIVDGRNRLKACELAGVEPRFDEIEFADEAQLRALVLDRNERRNITAGQKAMGHAILFPEPAKGGRGKKGPTLSGGFGADFLRMARAVLAYSPELAEQVRDSVTPLKEAFETVKVARERRVQLEWLECLAPDLAALVKEESLKLSEAIWKCDEREREKLRPHAQSLLECIEGIGRHLIEVKERVPGDRWLRWLEQHLGSTEEKALPFMRVAEQHAKGEPITDPDLTIDLFAFYRPEAEPAPETKT